ncbi:MAG TPA: methyltransferase domain-containing protein [Streptosporangiaceae bacterium]|nr:methyltransferase domain-containing protein [Streptosporangiaceae bacterium]
MPDREQRTTSFGLVADDYDRVRPPPPAEAVDWLVPEHCHIAVDLGAGTGLFTRALSGRVAHVFAVEPDERMRAVLSARSPGVRAPTACRCSQVTPYRRTC